MDKIKRIFLIVLDSFGIGEMPDAGDFGDEGSNTLAACAASGKLNIPNMIKLGLGNIEGVSCLEKAEKPLGAFCRLNEVSKGKDTTTGHWELAGLVSEQAFPTYPEGFPEEVIEMFKEATGLDVLCNKPYSGTQLIADYGKEHVETGKPIVYTSADSVFQVAAHEDVIPLEKLYEICEKEEAVQVAGVNYEPWELLAHFLKGMIRFLGIVDIVDLEDFDSTNVEYGPFSLLVVDNIELTEDQIYGTLKKISYFGIIGKICKNILLVV